MPIKTSSGKWKWGNVERSSKKELVQTVYGIWKKNGSKGSFSEFWHGKHKTNESSGERIYAYHCTNVDPEKIKKEGWKVGEAGFTVDNMFKDLYDEYLPKVPVFISRIDVPVWIVKSKYCLKIDITDLDLYPDFGSLPDTGAYYDGDNEEFYWEGFINGKDLAAYVNSQPDMTLLASDFSGEDSMKTLGTACVAGEDLNRLENRGIVEYVTKDGKKVTNESSKDKFFKVKKNGKEIGKYGLSFYDDIKAVGIGDLEVYPKFRNKGYGTKIIKDIVDKYKDDYDKIYCFVDKDNEDAIRLYKRLGKVSDEVTYSQKIGDDEYRNTNGQRYVEFYNKTNEAYEPPYTLDTIKQKYGVEAYRKLRDDPVHRFRAETGIEVIHKEPTRDEFERIVKNWDLMTPEQKKQSDEFSNKIFGNNNKNRIDLLRKEYDFEVGDKVKIRSGIRCRQSGHTGTIVRIDPPGTRDYDMHGWSSFIVKMDDPNLGTVGFQSGSIEKLDTVKEKWSKNGRYFYCDDCNKNMTKAPDDQYIMIDDDLWEYVCKHGGKKLVPDEDVLCRDCIEKRLGRRLTLKDLGDKINLPVNDEIKKMLKKRKNKMTNEAHEIHSYPEKLQPTLERIVKDNEDYELNHAYFNKEGKFIWMRNLKGYFHIFKPVKFVKTPGMTKPFGFKDLILKDNGMLEEVDRLRFADGNEGLKFLKDKYHLELKTIK